MTDVHDLNGDLGAHIPGNVVEVSPFFFTHEMSIELVTATFEHQDELDRRIELQGRRRKEGSDSRTSDGKIIKHSSTHLWAKIPGDATPGLYKCRTVIAHTSAGNSILFEDPDEDIDWSLWILAESDTPPKFGIW